MPTMLRMRFTSHLRNLAMSIANEAFGKSGFNAMHIRMGDYAWKRKDTEASKFISDVKAMHWNLSLPTYIATEPNRDEKFFAPLVEGLKKGNVLFSSDLPRHLVTRFTYAFPPGRIRGDMLGILEQLICAQGKSFYGTFFSTFSKYIKFMRQHRAELFPETLNLVDTGGDV